MSLDESPEHTYAFLADRLVGNHIHFRTISGWGRTGAHKRDIRGAVNINAQNLRNALLKLGDDLCEIREQSDFIHWIDSGSWAVVNESTARELMAPMLQDRTCVRTPLGWYLDTRLRGRVANHRPSRSVRDKVKSRDGYQCVKCYQQCDLTIHHVIPFSKGGATDESNLVTLCEPCNQNAADVLDYRYLALAGLHHGWVPSLMKEAGTSDSWRVAMEISGNLMVSYVDRREFKSFYSTSSVWNKPKRI